MDIIIIIGLIILSGTFSGLTIGLSALSKQDLSRLADLGDIKAKKVLSIISDGNLLLVTLLMGNTIVNSALSMFIGEVSGSGLVSLVIASSIILIFGEILPAAILTKYALDVGSKVTPLVKVLIKIFYILAKPIAIVLDLTLGKDLFSYFDRKELSHIIDSHQNSKESDLDEQDGRIIKGVLSLSEKTVENYMTNLEDIFSLSSYTLITDELLDTIRREGRTRIPVIIDGCIIGIINSKDLIGLDDELQDKKRAFDIMKSDKILTSKLEDNIDDILEEMINSHIHIANVVEINKTVGIITMEDILEEIFQKDIVDETD